MLLGFKTRQGPIKGLYFMAFDLFNQGGPVELQQLGGPILDPVGLFKGLDDQ